jgi:secondary thiamine-phosphate synthase enzyme
MICPCGTTNLSMTIRAHTINLQTKEFCEFIDLTELIEKFVSTSKINNGVVFTHSKHTTLTIRINERETGLIQDFKDFITKLVPKDNYYRHNDLNIRTENLVCDPGASDCLNAHSHIAHLLMGTAEPIPIVDGKLMLGPWQRIFAIELDCARKRQVFVQLLGE